MATQVDVDILVRKAFEREKFRAPFPEDIIDRVGQVIEINDDLRKQYLALGPNHGPVNQMIGKATKAFTGLQSGKSATAQRCTLFKTYTKLVK